MERTRVERELPGEQAQGDGESRREEQRQSNPCDLTEQDQSDWESTDPVSGLRPGHEPFCNVRRRVFIRVIFIVVFLLELRPSFGRPGPRSSAPRSASPNRRDGIEIIGSGPPTLCRLIGVEREGSQRRTSGLCHFVGTRGAATQGRYTDQIPSSRRSGAPSRGGTGSPDSSSPFSCSLTLFLRFGRQILTAT